jgi:hypothetical protein
VTNERLPEPAAKRVLDRASRLDAEHGSSVSLDMLREAALDAGISAEAFDAALAEERRGALAMGTRRRQPWMLLSAALTLVIIGSVLANRLFLPGARGIPPVVLGAVDESFVLRCSDPSTVMEQLRGRVPLRNIRASFSSKEPRVLHVTARPETMTSIRAAIADIEAASTTCVAPPN